MEQENVENISEEEVQGSQPIETPGIQFLSPNFELGGKKISGTNMATPTVHVALAAPQAYATGTNATTNTTCTVGANRRTVSPERGNGTGTILEALKPLLVLMNNSNRTIKLL